MARPHRITIRENQAKRWERHHAHPELWFWDWVDRSGGEDACWPWTGRIETGRRGYGRLKFKGHLIGAHRLALTISSGENHPELFACHRCDNPPCCNPAHLFWGTPQDNADDCAAKGRRRGAARKIDIPRLVELRKQGATWASLCAEFGVCQSSLARAISKSERSRGK